MFVKGDGGVSERMRWDEPLVHRGFLWALQRDKGDPERKWKRSRVRPCDWWITWEWTKNCRHMRTIKLQQDQRDPNQRNWDWMTDWDTCTFISNADGEAQENVPVISPKKLKETKHQAGGDQHWKRNQTPKNRDNHDADSTFVIDHGSYP